MKRQKIGEDGDGGVVIVSERQQFQSIRQRETKSKKEI